MSAVKRSRRPQADDGLHSASPLPASKRLKTHVPDKSGLAFLVDEKARAGRKLDAKLTNGLANAKTTRMNESYAVVAPGATEQDETAKTHEVIDISSGEEQSSDEEDQVDAPVALLTNGHAEDEEMEDADDAAEPSFGDMLQARHPEPIDVNASFADPMAERSAMVKSSGTQLLAPPSTTSLGTVLTQALKTNDRDLLESCFQVVDLPSIRSTIQRLQSQHVGTLLTRLAERIHKRPGRTGNLMVWVQWSLVAHGAYLSGQPDLMKKLRSLSQVVRERASGLQPLLHLKGKLDLLSAQLELRKNMQAASRAAHPEDDDDDEEAVLYVEGQDDEWSDNDTETKLLNGPSAKSHARLLSGASDSGEDDSADDDVPNGIAHDDDSEDEDEDAEDGGMLDIEAEEGASDDDEDEDEDSDDADSAAESEDSGSEEEDDSEEEISVRQPAAKTLNRKR
ncbi:Hypothetical protein R9X50_00697500 [Acrodontium crateriforme]|uniref:Small-subunit processome Utp12 domain-containing protein n=1 Tax=Acrodontium crateriforme TaxID=150365 RepID=A0AAQ3MA73_9PEZI|nr:Hypothetical protein R9X50_00697500 [Acrodontium crateriforme]